MDAFDRVRRHLKGPPRVIQEDFAKAVGLAQSQVSLIKQGKLTPPVDRIPIFNQLTGTTFEDWAKAAAALRRSRKRAA